VAIVTGSARGIGRAVADEFARRRLRVVINDLDANIPEEEEWDFDLTV
jgi:NAD(P)-dependent dehydrogenase (short-subunit alcohol dehydrogenase family)